MTDDQPRDAAVTSTTKVELERQADATLKLLYGCGLEEILQRAVKVGYDQGRKDERAEANRKKNRSRYQRGQEQPSLSLEPKPRGQPSTLDPLSLGLLHQIVEERAAGETVEAAIKGFQTNFRAFPQGPRSPLLGKKPAELARAYFNAKTRLKKDPQRLGKADSLPVILDARSRRNVF